MPGRPELRAEVGRVPRPRVVGRRERRDRQPRREAAHPLLSRTRRGVRAAAARAVPARRRGRRAEGRAGRAAARLGVADAAHPPGGIPREHARRDDAGDVHRVRPARPRRPRPAATSRSRCAGRELVDLLGGVPHPVHVTRTTDDADTRRSAGSREFEGAGLDGVVAKPLAQPYAPNKRTMFKIKHARTADVVAMGYRIHKSGQGVGSLLVGLYSDDGTAVSGRRRRGVEQRSAASSSSTSSRRSSSATRTVPRSPSEGEKSRFSAPGSRLVVRAPPPRARARGALRPARGLALPPHRAVRALAARPRPRVVHVRPARVRLGLRPRRRAGLIRRFSAASGFGDPHRNRITEPVGSESDAGVRFR